MESEFYFHKIGCHHHHHHHVALSARISLTPFSPPLPIVHCFRQVFRATSRIYTELLYVGSLWSSLPFPRLCEGVHRSTSLMSSSFTFSSSVPVCLVHLILIVFVIGGRWSYSCCFVGYCLQYFFNIVRSYHTKVKKQSLSSYLPKAGRRIAGWIAFSYSIYANEMQTASSEDLNSVRVSIFCDDNHYTTSASHTCNKRSTNKKYI